MHYVGLEYQLGFFSFSFLLHVLLHSELQSLHFAAISANNSDVKITHFLTVLAPLLAYSQLLLKGSFHLSSEYSCFQDRQSLGQIKSRV